MDNPSLPVIDWSAVVCKYLNVRKGEKKISRSPSKISTKEWRWVVLVKPSSTSAYGTVESQNLKLEVKPWWNDDNVEQNLADFLLFANVSVKEASS